MQKNGYTFVTVYSSKCVSVFLHQTIDGIFEIKMIKKICLGVIRFEIGQLELEILTCWNQLTLGAPFSNWGQETCFFLLPRASLYLYLTQNINGCPGIIFVWIRQMINQAEPSVNSILNTLVIRISKLLCLKLQCYIYRNTNHSL